MAISPTKLQTFKTCPYQYYAKYVSKEVKFADTPHTVFGTAVHANIENHLVFDAPLSPLLAQMKPIFDRAKPYLLGAETPLAINRQHIPVETKNKFTMYKEAWLHCIVDAIYADGKGKRLIAIDWKTGKESDARIQGDIIKLCMASKYPYFEQYEVIFVYLFKGGATRTIYRPKEQRLVQLYEDIAELEEAEKSKHFPPTPNGLCKKWCDVLSCPHNGRNK